jgi:mitochondrial splicing suppressor protein 51
LLSSIGRAFRRDGLIIDAYRLCIEDEYTLSRNVLGIYNQDPALLDFRRFLNKAEMRRRLLPLWWSKAKRRECEKLVKGLDVWMEIDCEVEKDDIVEHYGDASMSTFLWLLAKKVRAEVHSVWQLVFSPDTSHSC